MQRIHSLALSASGVPTQGALNHERGTHPKNLPKALSMQQLNHRASKVKRVFAEADCFAHTDQQNAPALFAVRDSMIDLYADLPAIQSLDDALIAA